MYHFGMRVMKQWNAARSTACTRIQNNGKTTLGNGVLVRQVAGRSAKESCSCHGYSGSIA